ncbi:hypothetical protein [uncultured Microbacterium sp.]|uniref:hypothetical protein n=1 Tax=uncultured Microbacterium sp. TaxID=191216 RepID=UPI002624CEF8|nr:hypothetical protein [uncultured Microbacterium sp.]
MLVQQQNTVIGRRLNIPQVALTEEVEVVVIDGQEYEGVRIDSERTEFSRTLHEWTAQRRLAETGHTTDKKKRASRISAEGSLTSTSTGLNESNGLSNSIMVGMTGFEPATP